MGEKKEVRKKAEERYRGWGRERGRKKEKEKERDNKEGERMRRQEKENNRWQNFWFKFWFYMKTRRRNQKWHMCEDRVGDGPAVMGEG